MTIYAVCMSCLSFMTMFSAGGHRSMIPILGILYGEKDYQGVRMLAWYVMRFTLLMVGVFVLFVFVFPQAVLRLFNIPPELFSDGTAALRLFSISLLGVAATFLMLNYYTTVQQRTAANILSFVEGLFAVVPAAWVLSRVMGLTGVWIAFIFAELAGFLCLFAYVRVVCKRSGGKLTDIYLIEKSGKELLYDVSLKATDEDAAKLAHEAVDVLKNSGLETEKAARAGIALEEMTVNLASYPGNKRPADIDVRINNVDGRILLALRDNGQPFNPVEYSPDETSDYRTDGIMLLKAMAKDIQYSRVLSLNQTIIEL